jgi:hypothetical protein
MLSYLTIIEKTFITVCIFYPAINTWKVLKCVAGEGCKR